MAARTLNDLCENVLSGVLVKGVANIDVRRDRLSTLRAKLNEDHFPDEPLRQLYRSICWYDDQTGDVLGEQEFEDLLDGAADAGTAALLLQMYRDFSSRSVDQDVFLFSIEQVRERKAARETDAALVTAVEVLRKGKDMPGGKELRGQKDARAYILSELSRIDKDLSFQESPEGNVRTDTDEMWAEYQRQVELNESGAFQGVRFGIDKLDEALNGIQAGDLVLTAGYTSSGKTTLCVQLAWWAAVMQGLNVVYITTETLLPQVRRKVIARHSCLPMFGLSGGSDQQGRLQPGGLNTRDLRKASLTPRELQAYKSCLDDMKNNPEYGDVDIVQMPMGGTMSDALMRAARYNRTKKIGLVILDYIELFRPTNSRVEAREGLNNNILEAKEYASTANEGKGTAVAGPWQVSRKARDNAATSLAYTLQDLGETKKASDTPDTIISVLEDLFRPKERIFEINLAAIKQRDGETTEPFKVDVDYATSCWGQAKQGGLFTGFGTSPNGGGPLGTLTLG